MSVFFVYYGKAQNMAKIDQPITQPGALKYSSATIKQQMPQTASPFPFKSFIT
ncbi:hypothetical protein [Limosilactobacillus oris]|uniref:hypothetical protein n=1 Tax=Limosilactobacillus oris TaxID=1632 RepID=UPI0024B3C27B|nr:hypothetical protein [Limosilactobacillus oris]WHO86447.1 hypothetical protein QLX69_04400 [Limosilactobacillus oris]